MPNTTLIDPPGRTVVLHESTWAKHIVPRHGDLANHRHLVESAIVNPFIITHSRSDPDCRLYHRPGPQPKVIMRVVVDVEQGLVKTAHLVREVSATETVEWLSQAP